MCERTVTMDTAHCGGEMASLWERPVTMNKVHGGGEMASLWERTVTMNTAHCGGEMASLWKRTVTMNTAHCGGEMASLWERLVSMNGRAYSSARDPISDHKIQWSWLISHRSLMSRHRFTWGRSNSVISKYTF